MPARFSGLARPERWALYLWLASGLWTVFAFLLPGIAMAILFMLGITLLLLPIAWVLYQTPTLFLYLSLFLPLYAMLRPISRIAAALGAVCIAAVVMIAIPTWANQRTEAAVNAFTFDDHGGPIRAAEGSTIAVLTDYRPFGRDDECEEYCQRLIFSGTAASVVRGNVDSLSDTASAVRRYRFAPRHGRCRPAPMTPAHADEKDVGRFYPLPLIQHAAAWRYAEGECFYADRVKLIAADIVLARRDFYQERSAGTLEFVHFDPRLGSIERLALVATHVRSGERKREVMRRSYAQASLLAVPLALDAPFHFNVSTPGRWRRGEGITSGREMAYGLQAFLTNDLRLRGLTDQRGRPVTLRDREKGAAR